MLIYTVSTNMGICRHMLKMPAKREMERTVNKEGEDFGFKILREAEVVAKDWVTWRRQIDGLTPHVERRER